MPVGPDTLPRTPKLCTVPGCIKPAPNAAMCPMHAYRVQKNGSPHIRRKTGPKPGTPRVIRDLPDTGYMCVACPDGKTTVKDSRQNEDGFTRRRRLCLQCGTKFSTIELPVDIPRSQTEYERYKLIEKKIMPELLRLADSIDLIRAEHE